MTMLSVNVNKIALLRNSRGRDFPNLCDFVSKLVNLNVKGITVHPRPDERHVTRQDVLDLTEFLGLYPDVEFNIDANEDTIAAANAAKAKPFKPEGKNCNNQGYALSA